MFFIGIITNKNSENNIKNRMINKIDENEIIFLNKENLENFKNVKFDSIIVNEEVENKYILKKIQAVNVIKHHVSLCKNKPHLLL